MRTLPAVLALPFLLTALGCHHEKKAVVPATTTNLATIPAPAPAPEPAGPKQCKADLDCGDKQLCIRGVCTDISAGLAECQLVRVHFDYNIANIHKGDFPHLQRVARCLKADQALLVRIEGNADERGTTEYNLALADKRATAVARYLETLGVTQAQLKTVSFGEERPLCVEHDEGCWAKNRRAAVKPQLPAQPDQPGQKGQKGKKGKKGKKGQRQ